MPKPKDPLAVPMDELWSYVDDKGNKQWGWLYQFYFYLLPIEKGSHQDSNHHGRGVQNRDH